VEGGGTEIPKDAVTGISRDKVKLIDPGQSGAKSAESSMELDSFARMWDGFVLAVSR
jgi:hypothetical protein